MLKGFRAGWFIVLLLGGFAAAKPALPAPSADVAQDLDSLKSMVPALKTAEKDLSALRDELSKTNNDDAAAEVNKRIAAQIEKVDKLRANFRIVATGVEEGSYMSETESTATLDTEFKDLVKPLMNELRDATSKPREMEQLRASFRVWKDRLALSKAAIDRLDPAIAAAKDDYVEAELNGAKKLWISRRDQATSETETLNRQIQERIKNTPSVIGAVSKMFAGFWRSRGLSLLMALGIAIVIYFVASRFYFLLRRFSPIHRRRKNGFAARSADLIAKAFSILLGVFSIIFVLYQRGDWLLLALAIVVVVGVVWASKEALPPYIGQIKTVLNLGPVRQGERIVYNGVPWKVETLNMDCYFANPELTGGVLRLPVAEVMKLHSRPSDTKEPWFPTRADDWVRLDDGCFGKVIQQTPEQVVVLQLGGSRKTYPAAEFLKRNPENLSRGYRVGATFGICQLPVADALETVPERLQEKIFGGLVAEFEREQVRSVKVEFSNAGAASMAYAIIADMDGELASKFRIVERLIQRLCMETCHEEGWEPALPQALVAVPR